MAVPEFIEASPSPVKRFTRDDGRCLTMDEVQALDNQDLRDYAFSKVWQPWDEEPWITLFDESIIIRTQVALLWLYSQVDRSLQRRTEESRNQPIDPGFNAWHRKSFALRARIHGLINLSERAAKKYTRDQRVLRLIVRDLVAAIEQHRDEITEDDEDLPLPADIELWSALDWIHWRPTNRSEEIPIADAVEVWFPDDTAEPEDDRD